jgi:hypothetical protein
MDEVELPTLPMLPDQGFMTSYELGRLQEFVREYATAAVLAERARCARACEAQITEPGLSDNPAYIRFNHADMMARKCAAAIREANQVRSIMSSPQLANEYPL